MRWTPVARAVAPAAGALASLVFMAAPVTAQSALPRFERAECLVNGEWAARVRRDCGWLVVPESRDHASANTVRLAVEIFPAQEPDGSPPLVLLHGGPGGPGAVRMFSPGVATSRLVQHRDVVLYDQRAAGLSEPKLCPAYESAADAAYNLRDGPPRDRMLREARRACIAELDAKGVDRLAHNTAASAADLVDLRRALGYASWDGPTHATAGSSCSSSRIRRDGPTRRASRRRQPYGSRRRGRRRRHPERRSRPPQSLTSAIGVPPRRVTIRCIPVTATLVLKNGLIVDGSTGPSFAGDVAIEGDRIVQVGAGLSGAAEIDCSGHVISPGFIDTHSHSDVRVLAEPDLPMKVRQGITLEVFGQDGISVAPVRPQDQQMWRQKLSGLLGDFGVNWDWGTVAGYLDRVRAAQPAQDAAYLAPHGALRQYAMGAEARRAGESEITAMQALLHQALSEGACGLSTGLIYPPCCYADTAELIALGEVLAEVGRPLVVHMRSEGDEIEEALEEMLTVARRSGCAVHISHLKIAGRDNWERALGIVETLELARLEGLQVTADQYPYAAGSTMLGAILPPWAHAGGTEATLARLADPAARQRMREQMASPRATDWENFWKWSGPEGIVVADIPSGRRPEWLGHNLADLARVRGKDPFDAAFDLLLEERMGVAMITFSQDESAVERFMRLPFVNVCTDGLLGGRPHPRAYGTYPRILARYVRERGTLTLEQAVRKMTSRAAEAFRLGDVGLLRPGYRANVVVFDPAIVEDRATFEDPLQYPLGIRDVIVGGQPVLRDGEETGARPGEVVR